MSEFAPADLSDFDFWLGEWEVSWPHEGRGRNVITRVLDDHVILENFDGNPGMAFRGMSVSTISAETGRWQQTWVDSEGGYLDFVGGMVDGRMILQRTAHRDGREFLQRMVFDEITANSLEWRWERSTDGGATWELLWPISYRRAGT